MPIITVTLAELQLGHKAGNIGTGDRIKIVTRSVRAPYSLFGTPSYIFSFRFPFGPRISLYNRRPNCLYSRSISIIFVRINFEYINFR